MTRVHQIWEDPPLHYETAAGPLRMHPSNPRYFTDGSGRAVYLTGSICVSLIRDRLRNLWVVLADQRRFGWTFVQLDVTGGDVQRNAINPLKSCLLRPFPAIRVEVYATGGFCNG